MATDFNIRPATTADRKALTALWQAFMQEQSAHDDRLPLADDAAERWQHDLPMWIDDDTVQIRVAEHEDEVVGFVRAHRTGPPPVYADCAEVYIDEVFVHDAHRRQGAATALVDAIAHWAAQVKADRLRLSTVAANEAASGFWQTYGAAPLGTIWTAPVESESAPEKKGSDVNEGSAKIGFDWN